MEENTAQTKANEETESTEEEVEEIEFDEFVRDIQKSMKATQSQQDEIGKKIDRFLNQSTKLERRIENLESEKKRIEEQTLSKLETMGLKIDESDDFVTIPKKLLVDAIAREVAKKAFPTLAKKVIKSPTQKS